MYHASCDNPVTTCRASHLRRRPVRIDAATIGHMPANSPDHLFTLPRSHRSGGHHQSQFGARGFLHHFPTAPSIESRNTNRMFHSLCEKADVPQLRVHDLRHSCATLLFTMGVQPATVQRILRHSSITVTTGTYVEVASSSC
ncbi:tyrosine-type recombinase/integrase [Mycobacterium sp.]|uniref:tyrosine-type recombinase/integrase n=1 Tax=Mycobacterium sp. TaxID=1785 RepID=UPI003C71D652